MRVRRRHPRSPLRPASSDVAAACFTAAASQTSPQAPATEAPAQEPNRNNRKNDVDWIGAASMRRARFAKAGTIASNRSPRARARSASSPALDALRGRAFAARGRYDDALKVLTTSSAANPGRNRRWNWRCCSRSSDARRMRRRRSRWWRGRSRRMAARWISRAWRGRGARWANRVRRAVVSARREPGGEGTRGRADRSDRLGRAVPREIQHAGCRRGVPHGAQGRPEVGGRVSRHRAGAEGRSARSRRARP